MGKHTKLKELDTYVELFGERYHVVLLNTRSIDQEEAIGALVSTLKCKASYARDCLKEAEESGEAYILTSHYERCELIQEILRKNETKLITKIKKD